MITSTFPTKHSLCPLGQVEQVSWSFQPTLRGSPGLAGVPKVGPFHLIGRLRPLTVHGVPGATARRPEHRAVRRDHGQIPPPYQGHVTETKFCAD